MNTYPFLYIHMYVCNLLIVHMPIFQKTFIGKYLFIFPSMESFLYAFYTKCGYIEMKSLCHHIPLSTRCHMLMTNLYGNKNNNNNSMSYMYSFTNCSFCYIPTYLPSHPPSRRDGKQIIMSLHLRLIHTKLLHKIKLKLHRSCLWHQGKAKQSKRTA